MKVLYVLEDYSINAYGVFSIVNEQIESLKGYINIDVISPSFSTISKKTFETKNPWLYSREFKNFLEKEILKYDIVHIHGLWMYPQYIAAKLAYKYNIPFIISFHGMLEPWIMDRKNIGFLKSLKKNIYLRYVLPCFRRATLIHAITYFEKENLKKFFPKNKFILIPNSINIEKIENLINKSSYFKPKKYILFIGRLDPKKGIDLLISAFLRLSLSAEWKLYIAGAGKNKEYVNSLKKLVYLNDTKKQIKFIPPVYGLKKFYLFRNAWVTVVPSYSEVVGMVNLESASCMTPTITTYETGLLEWENGGNLLVHPNVEDLLSALKKAVKWNFNERIIRGQLSKKYVEKNFSTYIIKNKWISLYSKLI